MEDEKVDDEYQALKDKIATAKCELCDRDWYDEEATIEELSEDVDSIESTDRCIDCWGFYKNESPDRI
ncbi:MAG: hypothetical protein PF542_06530 [Nanoarchaeota archaeon]|jgi:hypothetical protein|nr:hypothetical protein [Nanoarchaeota archaeon]